MNQYIGVKITTPGTYNTINGTAQFLGVNECVVRQWIRNQGLKCYRIEGSKCRKKLTLISMHDLKEFIHRKEKKAFYRIIDVRK